MKTLLIAEPSEILIDDLTSVLKEDWQIHICRDGCSAAETLLALQPDALIIDLKLPQKDGLTVLMECFPDLPPAIIAVSSTTTPCVEQSVARWGVDHLFQLPFDARKIRLCLDEAVGQTIPAKRTAQHLRVLGFRSNLDGYLCLITALPLLLQDPTQKLSKELYDPVAKICGLTDSRDVEHAIRTAIKDAWMQRIVSDWAKYFPVDSNGDVACPTVKAFLRCLMNRIR